MPKSKPTKTQKVQSPSLYQLQKGDLTFYILGTNHEAPLNALPKDCLKIIEQADHLIREAPAFLEPMVPSYEDLIKLGYVSDDLAEQDWFEQLDDNQKQKVLQCFDTVKSDYPDDFNPKQLKLWAIHHLVGGIQQLTGMDNLITEKHLKKHGKKAKISALDDPSICNDLNNLSEETTNILDLQISLERLDNGFDFSKHPEFSNGSINEYVEDSHCLVMERNQKWMKTLPDLVKNSKHHALVMVGNDHLGTSHGLLASFAKLGFSIKKMDAKGQFSNCIYSYPSLLPVYHAANHLFGLIKSKVNNFISSMKFKLGIYDNIDSDSIRLVTEKSDSFFKTQNDKINKVLGKLLSEKYDYNDRSSDLVHKLQATQDQLITVAYNQPQSQWQTAEQEIDKLVEASKAHLKVHKV